MLKPYITLSQTISFLLFLHVAVSSLLSYRCATVAIDSMYRSKWRSDYEFIGKMQTNPGLALGKNAA